MTYQAVKLARRDRLHPHRVLGSRRSMRRAIRLHGQVGAFLAEVKQFGLLLSRSTITTAHGMCMETIARSLLQIHRMSGLGFICAFTIRCWVDSIPTVPEKYRPMVVWQVQEIMWGIFLNVRCFGT